jgi:formate hydrogenlyase subunit 3/multisubunit Na+/H+ antiporter MnhD subunit
MPSLACFISEFLMFMGGFRVGSNDNFYYATTGLMIIATVFSLAYALRLIWKVFFESQKIQKAQDPSVIMSIPMIVLSVVVVLLGVWAGPIIHLIGSTSFG